MDLFDRLIIDVKRQEFLPACAVPHDQLVEKTTRRFVSVPRDLNVGISDRKILTNTKVHWPT